jgi:hypothetical protein
MKMLVISKLYLISASLFAHSPVWSRKAQIIFLFLSMFSIQSITAQNPEEKAIYDSLTYQYYQNAEWDSVIDIGKEALYKGYDFYYLRMRMGLAYDYQGNFRLAEIQYEKGLKMIPTDDNAAYYKYYAAINGGRPFVAYKNYSEFTDNQRKKIQPNKDKKNKYLFEDEVFGVDKRVDLKALDQLSFSYGYAFTNNNHKSEEILDKNNYQLFSSAYIRNNQSYFNLQLAGNASNSARWHFSYNFSNINMNYLNRILDSAVTTEDTRVKQNELYLGIEIFSGDGWSLGANAQYITYKSSYNYSELVSINYSIPPGEDSILSAQPVLNKTNGILENQDYVAGISLRKKINIFDIAAYANYAEIADRNPFQLAAELNIIPYGNYQFYINNRILYYNDQQDKKWIYKVSTGGKLIGKSRFEASATFGNLKYVVEPSSSVVYNWSENTTFKADVVLSYPLAKQVFLSLRYQISQKKSATYYYGIDDFEKSETLPNYYLATYKLFSNDFNFNQHFFILSLHWYL